MPHALTRPKIILLLLLEENSLLQTTEDRIQTLMSALGSIVSYVREDEQLQLSSAVSYEDLSSVYLGSDASQGEGCFALVDACLA